MCYNYMSMVVLENFMRTRLGAGIEGALAGFDAYLISLPAPDVQTGILAFAALFCAQNAIIVGVDIIDKREEARRQRGYEKSQVHRNALRARKRERVERRDREFYNSNSTAD